jgi:hypothetical protein
LALDRGAIETLKELQATEVEIITDLPEIIEPVTYPVVYEHPDPQDPSRSVQEQIEVQGARLRAGEPQKTKMNLYQAGLTPNFYQFSEAVIEVKMSVSLRETRDETEEGHEAQEVKQRGLWKSSVHTSTVDYRSANTYSYSASGASLLRVVMKPVPPPPRLQPRTVTVDTQTEPPTVRTQDE